MKNNLHILSIDIGGTHTRCALVNRECSVIYKEKTLTPADTKTTDRFLKKLIKFVKTVIERSDITLSQIKAIGVSAIGILDIRKGHILSSSSIPLTNIPLLPALKKAFGKKVYLLNDCNAAALAEWYFNGKEKDLVFISISSGIGGGAVIGGKLIEGRGNAGEVGHMYINSEYQIKCSCGSGFNHWEAFASGNNIPDFFKVWIKKREIKQPGFDHSSAREIFNAAKKGNEIALEFIKELNKVNGRGVSNVISAYNPEVIIFGGSVALHNADLLLNGIRDNLDELFEVPGLKITSLEHNASLLGAAIKVIISKEF